MKTYYHFTRLLYLAVLFPTALLRAAVPLASSSAGESPNQESEDIFKAFHFLMPAEGLPKESTTVVPLSSPAVFPLEFRSIDGTGNNLANPLLGSANTPFKRTTTIAYGDGKSSPAGANEQSARAISNLVDAETGSTLIAGNDSAYWWAWGQFIDHDMTLTPIANPIERFNIVVPTGDPVFDPNSTGTQTLPFQRSAFTTDGLGVRQQLNANTAFIDASMVYGSDSARAQELRTLDGTGHLKTSTNNLLPFNVNGFPNEPTTDAIFFLAGDVRANENSDLLALQTLFVREHNFWADKFKKGDKTLTDDDLYNRARAMVGAEIQKITYQDFVPGLIGKTTLSAYAGYNENADPTIANVFSAAAYRFGHSLLNATISRLDANNQSIGDLLLQNSFFQPAQMTRVGIEPFLRGLAQQRPEEIDALVVDGVRNFNKSGPGFDLVALNIQRGRDHGLPGFNQVRVDYGLPALTSFSQITTDPNLQAQLASVYPTVDDVDAWVGMLCETHSRNALVGPTIVAVLKDQFERLRDGDRFWYESYLDPTDLAVVQKTKLSDIIRRNTTITTELQKNVFSLPPAQ